eukprot:scaffold2556_cov153-Skeletonema_menzelii.AAC.4
MSGNNDGRPTSNHNMTSRRGSSSPPPISLSTDTDAAYCTELSRRSIARAALHLGIEHMETSALDILGSVVLGYLQRVGDTIATNVEGSGRSSGHVNAYDVLNAVDQEALAASAAVSAAVAAQQLQSSSNGAVGSTTTQQLQQEQAKLDRGQNIMIEGGSSNRGWEGLASFLFGSNWYSIPLEGDGETVDTPKDKENKLASSSSTIMNGTTTTLNGGGKGGPPTATASSSSNSSTGKILPTENTSTISTTTPTSATTKVTVVGGASGAKSGKGKQLSNMTPPPGVSVVGNEVIMGNTPATTTTSGGTNEKNVSFSLERKNSKGASAAAAAGGDASILLHGVNGDVDNNNNSSNHNSNSSSKNNHSNNPSSDRWDAPYLNEVPPFPLVTRTEHIANPHCLSGTNIPLSMHDLATEQEACRDNHTTSSSSSSSKKQRRGSGGGIAGWKSDIADLKLKIPKDVFATKDIIWGSMKQSDDSHKNKMKKDDTNGNTNKTTENEKSSSVGGGGGGGSGGTLLLPKLPAVEMPSYVPNFFPPFPRTEESISSVPFSVPTTAVMSDVMSRVSQKRKSPSSGGSQKSNETAAAERSTVRHSLVELGKNSVGSSYWGSNWLNNSDDDDVTRKSKEKLKFNNAVGQLTVTPGPSSSATSGKKAAAGGGDGVDAQVVPLRRASGSRVAKILEGSN